ncbi:GNAT family N-acetyltransferase [Chitinophaga sp. Cy-1792]|uniref:GNAT family N-acetyltransferase n=1 Tax=Chitinophaga sp. Cy-1792 TaxID=2608339 RepID=UPI0014222798|nr:GNAT family N-acetyltransferase [Chitinophaga sp. Cy-1792]
MTRTIHYADTDETILACTDAIVALRPHLQGVDFLPQIKEMQEEEGYMLIYVTADEKPDEVAAIAGFRRLNKLLGGKHIYIDDLSTLPKHQKKGYASDLLEHIRELAEKQGLGSVRLTSGHTLAPAHRLYMNHGFFISAHSFMLKLTDNF